jgi:hypothetical protein
MYFEANVQTGGALNNIHSNEITDPVMYINLPAGIALDPSTVQVLSAAGANGPVFLPVSVTATKLLNVNGVMWTSYQVQVNNKYDIIARGLNNMNMNTAAVSGSGLAAIYTNETYFTLRFTANVAVNSSAYSVIAMEDIVNVDLGQTAVNASGGASYVIPDANNWAGKGTSYNVMAATQVSNSPNCSVVQQPGLSLFLGIRNLGSTGSYYYYNGLPGSIAALSPVNLAELQIQYQNTSSDVYYAGTEIYLPIPKQGLMYDHYFNNTNRDTPADVEPAGSANTAPQWSADLAAQVTLPGFTTYYGVSASPTTNFNVPVDNTWTPMTMTWYDYPGLTAAGYTLTDVTMLKFVATQDIAAAGSSGASGSTTLLLSVANASTIGYLDYWRSYEKGWRTSDGAGNWMYGSVVAAMPAVQGVMGKFFDDLNVNGVSDTGEAYTATAQMPAGFTATLSGTGITTPLPMTIDAQGNFQSLNADGTVYYLLIGTYTVTITNPSPTVWHFTSVTPPTRSYFNSTNNPVWYNDVPQSLIKTDNTSAVFTFQVLPTSTVTQLVGIGLKAAPTFIPVNPHVRAW